MRSGRRGARSFTSRWASRSSSLSCSRRSGLPATTRCCRARSSWRSAQSDLLYLSALYERAMAIFYGKIRVEPTSHGTGSYQECRNMLLSPEAGADPIPVLEILTNDVVRCGHGATAGALGDEELFYAMSRGFDRDQAQQLMVHGFFRRVINQLDDEHVRQRVLNALRPRIGNIAEMGVLA